MSAQQTKDENTPEEIFHAAIHSAIGKPYTKNQPHRKEHSKSWAKTTVDSKRRKVSIQVLLRFRSPSLKQSDRQNLIALAAAGIKRYWSRSISVNGVIYSVDVSVMHSDASHIPVILKINTGKNYGRSSNAGILGIDARFIHNVNYFPTKQMADEDFSLTSAHEFGHSVLKAAGGIRLSWGHKGSTGVITQAVKKTTPGYPTAGPIDLMKYYDDNKQNINFHQLIANSIAGEKDVMRLIWLSSLTWN